MSKRSPLCVVVGHVDHGKSSILDKIRGTAIVKSEAGQITQAIGASIIPIETIKKVCGPLLERLKLNITIPGLLFIDTPGHAAFTSLRRRGGNLADIAILVVDINEGFKPQTIEAIEILRSYKTPFIVAANKVDMIAGWKSLENSTLIEDIKGQKEDVSQKLDAKLYELVAKFYELGFESERFDRLEDFTRQLAIIPCSAKTGVGLAELLSIITGLAQKFLEKRLEFEEDIPGKGTILEVKEEVGLGKTLDVIIYDGTIKKGDTIVIGTTSEPLVTKVKALLEPAPLEEMRDKKAKFLNVDKAVAATGVKIAAQDLTGAISGMPVRVAENDLDIEKIKQEIQSEIESLLIETEKEGIIIKADSLGGLEALTNLLKEKKVKIKKASIGNISQRDISEAESVFEKSPAQAVILGFNVEINKEAILSLKAKIILNKVIYRLLEEFDAWQKKANENIEELTLNAITRPVKIKLMPNHTFRQNNPAIVGTDILSGKIRTGMALAKDGKQITIVKSMKDGEDHVTEASAPKQLAVAYNDVTVGRQINEGDILYSVITEDEFRKLKGLKDHLTKDETEILKEIALIMRKENPLWGV